MKKTLLWALLITPLFMFAQLSISSTPTAATCQGNGSVAITLDGTQNTYNYNIVLTRTGGVAGNVADNRDKSFTATGNSLTETFNNLNAGNWTINIYETTGGGTNTGVESSDSFIINDDFVEPQINAITRDNCAYEDIIVNSSPSGKFVSFRLLSSDGSTEIRGTQTENIFELVFPGNYRVEAKDLCGQKYIQDITVGPMKASDYLIRRPNNTPGSFPFHGFNLIESCNADGSKTVKHVLQIYLNGDYFRSPMHDDRFPINLTYQYLDNTGSIISTKEFIFNDYNEYKNGNKLSLNIPANTTSVKTVLVDKCNITHEQTDVISTEQKINRNTRTAACGSKYYLLQNVGIGLPFTITFNSVPNGVKPSDFDISNATTADDNAMTLTFTEYDEIGYLQFGNSNNALPAGNYNFTYTDQCGYESHETFEITSDLSITSKNLPSCELGKISVQIFLRDGNSNRKSGDITYAEIINGPDNSITYPFDLSPYINKGRITLDLSPPQPGDDPYVITTSNSNDTSVIGTSCGENFTESFTFQDHNKTRIELANSTLYPGCSAFQYSFIIGDKHAASTSAFLEKYNPNLDKWIKVTDNINSVRINELYTLSVSGTNATAGKFRLAFKFNVYANGGITYCAMNMDEFEYDGIVQIEDYYVTQCTGGTNDNYDLLIDAFGPEPLQYKIVSINGDTSQGTSYQASPIFLELSEGSYKVEVKDDCGNTKNATFEVNKVKQPKIIADLCEGEFGTLKTSGLSRFQTEWYKDGALVSDDDISDNILMFNPYSEANDLGEYIAKILYTGANNCGPLDTLPFNATSNTAIAPNAGTVINPNTAIGSNGVIDINNDGKTNLFNYIEDFDNYGTWSEVPNANGDVSNLLIADDWQYEFAASGTYTFKHTLEGTCSGVSKTELVINYTAPCDRPFNQLDTKIFTSIGISNLDKNNVADWPNSVPSGFIVLESNTKGFTITRIADPETTIGTNAKEGMLVFDTDEGANGCFKLYNGTSWNCIENCNDK